VYLGNGYFLISRKTKTYESQQTPRFSLQPRKYRSYDNFYLSMFEESPKGVDPKVNSRSYSGTESSSTGALSLA
jgi:hypothetical protein